MTYDFPTSRPSSIAGQTVELGDEMMLITAAVILHTMFSTESSNDLLEIKEAVGVMVSYAGATLNNPIKLPRWLPTPANRCYYKAREMVQRW